MANNKDKLFLIQMVLITIIMIVLFCLVNFTLNIICLMIILIILSPLVYSFYVVFKDNQFRIEETNSFNIQECDLIKTKASEWLEEANRRNIFPNDKLDKLAYFYEDFEQINSSLMPELEYMLRKNNFLKKIKKREDFWILYLVKNLQFLISIKEKEFENAYKYLKELNSLAEIEMARRYIFNQTIDGKELVLVYLLKYKNNETIDEIIRLLFTFNTKVGKVYLESLSLSEEDINYCLKRMESK